MLILCKKCKERLSGYYCSRCGANNREQVIKAITARDGGSDEVSNETSV